MSFISFFFFSSFFLSYLHSARLARDASFCQAGRVSSLQARKRWFRLRLPIRLDLLSDDQILDFDKLVWYIYDKRHSGRSSSQHWDHSCLPQFSKLEIVLDICNYQRNSGQPPLHSPRMRKRNPEDRQKKLV